MRLLLTMTFLAFVWADRWDSFTESESSDCLEAPVLPNTTPDVTSTAAVTTSSTPTSTAPSTVEEQRFPSTVLTTSTAFETSALTTSHSTTTIVETPTSTVTNSMSSVDSMVSEGTTSTGSETIPETTVPTTQDTTTTRETSTSTSRSTPVPITSTGTETVKITSTINLVVTSSTSVTTELATSSVMQTSSKPPETTMSTVFLTTTSTPMTHSVTKEKASTEATETMKTRTASETTSEQDHITAPIAVNPSPATSATSVASTFPAAPFTTVGDAVSTTSQQSTELTEKVTSSTVDSSTEITKHATTMHATSLPRRTLHDTTDFVFPSHAITSDSSSTITQPDVASSYSTTITDSPIDEHTKIVSNKVSSSGSDHVTATSRTATSVPSTTNAFVSTETSTTEKKTYPEVTSPFTSTTANASISDGTIGEFADSSAAQYSTNEASTSNDPSQPVYSSHVPSSSRKSMETDTPTTPTTEITATVRKVDVNESEVTQPSSLETRETTSMESTVIETDNASKKTITTTRTAARSDHTNDNVKPSIVTTVDIRVSATTTVPTSESTTTTVEITGTVSSQLSTSGSTSTDSTVSVTTDFGPNSSTTNRKAVSTIDNTENVPEYSTVTEQSVTSPVKEESSMLDIVTQSEETGGSTVTGNNAATTTTPANTSALQMTDSAEKTPTTVETTAESKIGGTTIKKELEETADFVETTAVGVETTTEQQQENAEVVHFQDLNVDEPEPTIPEYCQDVCPPGFNESGTLCYMLAPPEKSTTYSLAISYCQSLISPRSDLATAYDFQDEDNRKLFQELLAEVGRSSDAFVVNVQGSASFRRYRMIDLIFLNLVTRFSVNPYLSVEVARKLESVNAICRTTKFCKPNVCPLELFFEYDKELVVGLPRERTELKEGEELVVPCIQYGTGQTHLIRCRPNGQFSVHPSLIECRKPDDFEEEEPATPLSPLFPSSCDLCYEVGTETCTKNLNGPGVLCNCKKGWTKRTCWLSPQLCTKTTCGDHGQCLSLVDHTVCKCDFGWTGQRCTVNATRVSWLGTNDSLAVFDLRAGGMATQSASSMLIILLKFLSKIITEKNCEDPQDTFQDYRSVTMTIAGFLGILFTHPDLFGTDAVGCRFHFMMLTIAYTLGMFFWANEALNIMLVCRAVNKNEWSVDFDGLKQKYLRFSYRMTAPVIATILLVIALVANSWKTVGNSFNCFGSFSKSASNTWMPLLALNGLFLLIAFIGAGGASLVLRKRPHCFIRLTHWFNLYRPAQMEQINKVKRNLPFVFIGPVLHISVWITLSIASEENHIIMDTISFVLSLLYAAFNLVQFFITDADYFGRLSVLLMCILPKEWSPTFDWNRLRNREETLALKFNWRYKKEQDAEIREEDVRLATERREISLKNEQLLERFPNLPAQLLYHCSQEGPAISHPRRFPFNPANKEYMTQYEREQLLRIWTRSYLDSRSFTKRSPGECAFDVIKMEIKRHCFQQPTHDRRQQELWLLSEWWFAIPANDRINLTAHDRTVVMEDPNETPLQAFDRAVSKLVSIIDLRENRKRRGLLIDHEIKPFTAASAFIHFMPPNPIEVCKCLVLDRHDDIYEKEYVKSPDIVLDEQILEWEAIYKKDIEELNEPFAKVYDDDLMFSQWVETDFEEAAREILEVVPSQIGIHPISMNPRKRPLDSHWLDTEKPDFIGPREESEEVPLGPYGSYARACHYYHRLLEEQWQKYKYNAAIVRAGELLRKGEL